MDQRTANKRKGIVADDVGKAPNVTRDDNSSNDNDDDDANDDLVEAMRRSHAENYVVATDADEAITTKPTTTEVLEEEVEEELVDYEASLENSELPYDPAIEVVRDFEEYEILRRPVQEDVIDFLSQHMPSSAPSGPREENTKEEVQERRVEMQVAQNDLLRETEIAHEVIPVEVPQVQVSREVLREEGLLVPVW